MHVKQYSSLCERLNPLRKIKYMDYRKRILGIADFCNNLVCGSGSNALKKKYFNNGNSAKSAKKSVPAPSHLAGIYEIFAIPFYFERAACPDLSGFSQLSLIKKC